MATIQERPFSKNYSGLINQSVIGLGIAVLCVTSHELMRRARRGTKVSKTGLGSVESWEFGYLFQGRSWATKPSPALHRGWPLSWVKQAVIFPEQRINELRGVDATLYCRFIRGCWWFVLLHSFTTFPILFPIHVEFSPSWVSPKSMTRASISSLVSTEKGLSLLWIHICLLFWVTLTWMYVLYWITRGAFRYRAANIRTAAELVAHENELEKDSQYHPHPHPQYPFQALPSLDHDHSARGLRLRTVMVTNVPPQLRSEKEMKEYFEYYLSRRISKPSMGLGAFTQPGLINKTVSFVLIRAKRLLSKLIYVTSQSDALDPTEAGPDQEGGAEEANSTEVPAIDRVVIARKMTELASLLERREDVLRRLETAHIKLATNAILDVKEIMDNESNPRVRSSARLFRDKLATQTTSGTDLERGDTDHGTLEGESRQDLLVRVLGPYVEEFGLCGRGKLRKSKIIEVDGPDVELGVSQERHSSKTVWDALLSLPRSTLDEYQPLINLSALFRGKTVPSIDYYCAKLGLLTALITENRSRAIHDYDPVSTAFVTFVEPADARRACKYLAVHPENPMACLVTMAPSYEDLDWIRVMKSSFRAEFLKDWVVEIGVWAFTLFWLLPLSFFVTLVSIQNISAYWPWLKQYLENHEWEGEVVQSFLPTLLVALLSITIPLLLLLIAKKAHTIVTLSALHDRILTRYYKFLIVNVLVFFCIGTAALQSFLVHFSATPAGLIQTISDSFPSAGPFYVGWLIFTTAMHGGFELALFGLPLLMYPSTRHQVTPRKRAVGIRPRTFNYYYWLPNHVLIIHVLLLFSTLNPLVLPFGLLYFSVELAVIKNQLIHVYAKNYEGNGQLMLIRIIRYSLDGLVFTQAVFLAYMTVLKNRINTGLAGFLIIFTVFMKIVATRLVRASYERYDIIEANVMCGKEDACRQLPSESYATSDAGGDDDDRPAGNDRPPTDRESHSWSWRLPTKLHFSYSTMPSRPRHPPRHQPIPFAPQTPPFTRLRSFEIQRPKSEVYDEGVAERASASMPSLDAGNVHRGQTRQTDADVLSAHSENPAPLLVTPHRPHPTWNDESDPNHPYDNPYYTRAVSNVLWLPRNPFGPLDLDDTIDLHKALISEPGADQMERGLNEQVATTMSGLSGVPLSTITSLDGSLFDRRTLSTTRQYSGSEDISLPPAIRSRVMSVDREQDVEVASTPSSQPFPFYRRRASSSIDTSPGSSGANSRMLSPPRGPARTNMRSFSSGEARTRRSMSLLSQPDSRRARRSVSTDDAGTRPDFHAQAEFARSTLSMVNSSAATLPRHPHFAGPAGASVISTQEAVIHEVIKEEQEAAESRLREEQHEAETTHKSKRSWWTAWLFKSAER